MPHIAAAAPAGLTSTAAPSAVEALLARARAGWTRLSATQAWEAVRDGALLVDTRTEAQRSGTGELPGALVIDRTVLEWRLDPTSPYRIPEADRRPRIVLVCRQGFSSSVAARSLRDLGLDATDVVDGVEGWLAAGLPVTRDPADVRE